MSSVCLINNVVFFRSNSRFAVVCNSRSSHLQLVGVQTILEKNRTVSDQQQQQGIVKTNPIIPLEVTILAFLCTLIIFAHVCIRSNCFYRVYKCKRQSRRDSCAFLVFRYGRTVGFVLSTENERNDRCSHIRFSHVGLPRTSWRFPS